MSTIERANTTKWLRCDVTQGMFSHEAAATYMLNGRQICSEFVPIDTVRWDASGQGQVSVEVFERDGQWYAVLPTNYRDVIPIDKADLLS